MQLELNLSNTTEAERLIAKFKAQHDLTLWRIEQENKLLKEVEAKIALYLQKLELLNYLQEQQHIKNAA